MGLKQRLERQLHHVRRVSERLLEDFRSPAEWTRQVHPGCNHALWFAGHMACTDNFLISLVGPRQAQNLSSFDRRFGMGSQPTSDPADYPPVAEVLDAMRERRGTLLRILADLPADELSRPTPQGTPDFLGDYASVFEMAHWHEWLHNGQLTVARRSLGHAPLSSQWFQDAAEP